MREVNNDPRRRNVFGGIFAVLAAATLTSILGYGSQTVQADEGHVVINEIMAKPDNGKKEWVELYNPTDRSVDLSGWRLEHSGSNFTGVFGDGVKIPAKSYLVREANSSSSALNNTSGTITLQDKDKKYVYPVTYSGVEQDKSYARTTDGGSDWNPNAEPTKASWNLLDVKAPEVTDLTVVNSDRWGNLNLWEDSRFKNGNKIIVGGTIKLGATFSDDQRLEEASIKVKGEGEEKTFSGDDVTREGTNPTDVTATWDTGDRDGNYTATFTAKDGGRILGELPNETTHTIDLIVDNTDPTVSFSGLKDEANHDTYFEDGLTVKTTLNDPNGISRVWLGIRKLGSDVSTEIADASWPEKNWSHELDTSAYADGTYELLLKAWDIAGNVSDVQVQQITLNNFSPTTPTVVEPGSGTAVNGLGTILDWTDGEDGNGGITYKFQWSTTSDMNGMIAAESREGFADSSLPIPVNQADGTYFWRIQACDKFDVCGEWSDMWSVIIDTKGPALTVSTPLRNGDGTYMVSGTTDEDMPIYIYLDEESVPVEVQPVNGTWSYITDVPLILGEHTFLIKSYDGVGNEGTSDVTFSVKIEPTIEVLSERPQPLSAVSESPAAVIAATSPVTPDVLQEAIEANSEVLGTSATEPDDAAPVEATPRGWILLGVEWYWWLLGISGLGAGGWLFMNRRGAGGA